MKQQNRLSCRIDRCRGREARVAYTATSTGTKLANGTKRPRRNRRSRLRFRWSGASGCARRNHLPLRMPPLCPFALRAGPRLLRFGAEARRPSNPLLPSGAPCPKRLGAPPALDRPDAAPLRLPMPSLFRRSARACRSRSFSPAMPRFSRGALADAPPLPACLPAGAPSRLPSEPLPSCPSLPDRAVLEPVRLSPSAPSPAGRSPFLSGRTRHFSP